MGSCETCKHTNKMGYESPCIECTHNATDNYEPMTNADRIRNMTDEELAKFLVDDENFCACRECDYYGIESGQYVCARDYNFVCVKEYASALILRWLQREVEKGE